MIQSTRLAKVVYWLSGMASYIKWPTKLYEINDVTDDLDNMFTRVVGRSWMSCSLTWRMLGWAQSLDRKHFDHWALDHSDCQTFYHLDLYFCPDCKSSYCESKFSDDE